MNRISRLQYITTNAEMAEKACLGGIDWIQLRLKNVSYDEYKAVALKVQAVCKKYSATLIINDNVKLALDIRSDGVHVGQDDPLNMDDINELLARNAITGATVNTTEDILHFRGKPVSYLGFGPFRFTATKQKLSPVLGLEGYKRVFEELKHTDMRPVPPLIGIGGITIEDIPALLATGLHGVAVSGAISNTADITEAARNFVNAVNKETQQ